MGEKDKRIAELEILLKAALDEIERLKARIVQLEKHSGNSSKPPSSDIVKPPKTPDCNGKRKIGAQKGHERHLRNPFGESQVDKTVDLILEACPICGEALQDTCEAPRKHQQIELVEKPFIVTEYRTHRYWCASCQCYHESSLPKEALSAGLFGRNLIALTAYMKGRCHMSYRTIQCFYADALSLAISTGFLVKQVGKASEALKAPYDNLVGRLPLAGHLHVDETGSKENGKSRWAWCFRGKGFTVFHIDPSRSSAVLERLLGIDYAGVISSDFHSVYKRFSQVSKARLQLCWAHLIREVKFIAEQANTEVSAWGKSLLEQIRKMFMAYHRRKDLSARNWHRKMHSCRESILEVALNRVPPYKIAGSLSARFKNWQGEYFRFIDEGIPPTNNLCEQSIRPVVIDRKITQGTRGVWGNSMSERAWTVLATCAQRGDNVMAFMRSCVGAFLQGLSPPLFPV